MKLDLLCGTDNGNVDNESLYNQKKSNKKGCLEDERAQWMIISSVVLAAAIVGLSLMLCTVSNSYQKTSFTAHVVPYYEIRSLLTELKRAYKNGDLNQSNKDEVLKNVSFLYYSKGYLVNISLNNVPTISSFINVSEISVSFKTKHLSFRADEYATRFK